MRLEKPQEYLALTLHTQNQENTFKISYFPDS